MTVGQFEKKNVLFAHDFVLQMFNNHKEWVKTKGVTIRMKPWTLFCVWDRDLTKIKKPFYVTMYVVD